MNKNSSLGKIVNVVLRYKVYLILILICIVASIASPYFLTSSNILNVFRQISMNGIIAIGFTFVLAEGSIDLSVGSMVGLIGVITAMIGKLGVPVPFITLPLIAIAVGVGLGFINGFIVSSLRVPSFIATLATQIAMRGVIYVITHNQHITRLPSELEYFGQGYISIIPFPVIILLVITIIGYFILKRTQFGRHVIAVGSNRDAAHYCGISVRRTEYGVFIFMGICAGIAALILTGRSGAAQTGAGVNMEMDSIAAVVMGGTPMTGGYGNIVGSIGGSLIIGVISNVLNLTRVDSNWQYIVKGLLIIIAVLLDVQSTRIQNRISDRSVNKEVKPKDTKT